MHSSHNIYKLIPKIKTWKCILILIVLKKKEPLKMVLLVKETHWKDNHILSSKLLHHFLKLSYWRGRCEAKFIRELSLCKRRKKFHLMNKLHVMNQRIICSSWRGPRVT